MRWKGRNINQCMGNTEFLRCGSFYFAVVVRHSQLHVAETLLPLKCLSVEDDYATVSCEYCTFLSVVVQFIFISPLFFKT